MQYLAVTVIQLGLAAVSVLLPIPVSELGGWEVLPGFHGGMEG